MTRDLLRLAEKALYQAIRSRLCHRNVCLPSLVSEMQQGLLICGNVCKAFLGLLSDVVEEHVQWDLAVYDAQMVVKTIEGEHGIQRTHSLGQPVASGRTKLHLP